MRVPPAPIRFYSIRTVLTSAATTVILFAVAIALAIASRWPLVHDAPLMHYVVFLMDHGFAPYRDIVEMNMPGSYMQEWAVIHTLGGGAHAWFVWDALTGMTAILSGAWLTGAGHRWAGASGAGLAYLLHLKDGAGNLGQRDWVVAVLLIAAFASAFEFRRTNSAWWMAFAACLCAAATTIKPPVVVAPVLLLAGVLWLQHRQCKPCAPALMWSLIGTIPPIVAVCLFLVQWGVWREFAGTLRGIVPYYAGLQSLPMAVLLRQSVPKPILPLVAGALLLSIAHRGWKTWESIFLAMGAAIGFGLFFLQRKGWAYHRYTALTFLLIWLMVEVDRALASKNSVLRFSSVVLLCAASFGLPLLSLRSERNAEYPTAVVDHLQQDLGRFGGSSLSGSVQCLDMALGGCINALYRLRLVQSTGFIYDFYLFPQQNTSLTRALQTKFLSAIEAKPPRVIVLSSQNWPGDEFGYEQLDRWPSFKRFLNARYTLSGGYRLDPQHASIGYELFTLNE